MSITRCTCDIKPGMTRAQLVDLGGGCTMPAFCCPQLDKVRRAMRPDPEPKREPANTEEQPRAAVSRVTPQRWKSVQPVEYDPFASQIRRQSS